MLKPRLQSGGGPITTGLAKKADPHLGVPGFLSLDGLHFDEAGSLTKWQGFVKKNTVALGTQRFTGRFTYTRSDGTSQDLAATEAGLFRYGTPTANAWNALAMPAGYTWSMNGEDLVDWAVFDNVLYIVNGTSGNLSYDGTTLQRLGIAAPATTATAAVGAAGSLSGAYSYRVTFFNSTLGHESNPSAVTNTVTVTNQRINLTAIPVSTDPQVTRRRLYRTTTGGAQWLFVAEIADNTTTTHTDNALDATLGIEVDEFGNGVPPIAAMILLFKGRLFLIPKSSSRVHFSKLGFPNAVDEADFRDLDANDGTNCSGMARLFDQLIVFKGKSIWNGFGDDATSFGFIRQVSEVGAVSPRAIVYLPGHGRLLFLDENGFYTYDGLEAAYASLEIEPDVDALDQPKLATAVGIIYRERNMALFAVVPSGGTQKTRLLVYDYTAGQWATRSLANTAANVLYSSRDAGGTEVLEAAGYSGTVWLGDTGQGDDGAAIPVELITRAYPQHSPKKPRPIPEGEAILFKDLVVPFEPQAGSSLAASYAVDSHTAAYTAIGTVDLSAASGIARLPFGVVAKRLYVKLGHTALSQPVTLRGLPRIDTVKALGRVA